MPLSNSKSRYHHWKVVVLTTVGLASCFLFAGSAAAYEKAIVGAAASSEQTVEFDVYLPLRDRAGAEALLTQLHDPDSALYHHWVSPAEFAERFGPQAGTVQAISRELAARGLEVTQVHSHSLHVSGSVAAVKSALGTTLLMGHFASGKQALVAETPIKLTPSLEAAGAVIADFSGKIRVQKISPGRLRNPQNRESPVGGYWFDDLKQAYSYPSYKVLTGKGVTIGILMEGDFNRRDMNLYFSHEKIATPKIRTVNIGTGSPFDPDGSFETHLDIQQSGGMAPKASIILYNLPDLSDQNILAGLTNIIESNVADVVNMSFGGPEAGYTAPYNGGVDLTGFLGIYDDFFMEGSALGITFVSSSGDWGAKDIPAPACFDAKPPSPCGPMEVGIGLPASSPHVTAVGGTNLVTTFNAKNPKDLNSAYVSENADFDVLEGDIFFGTTATGAIWGSGGGISMYYKKPAFQRLVSQKNLPAAAAKWRTIPDVSLHMGGCPNGTVLINNMCPPDRSFVWEFIGGKQEGVVGTSASSPDFAGLVALKIESTGARLGNENFDIYSLAAAQAAGSGNTVYRDDIPGNNGKYKSLPGYNLVLGNGTLFGGDFVRGPSLPVAGKPQTPTNP
jgi:subtilase family serine protease